MVRTVNLNLLLSVRTEGMKFIEEMKSKREKEVVQQLPGLDIQFYIPYSKVELTLELDMHAYRIGCLYMFTCTCKWNVSHHVHVRVLNM